MLDATPVNLLTGFLGSGKTTLLRRLLDDPALADTAVLINEFGEVGLDHDLLGRIDETTILLKSGCLCCTIRGELSAAIKDLHSRRERAELPVFRRLVVESTGLADPFPILSTIQADPVLRHHFRLGNVITTVDAVNGGDHLRLRPESAKQVAVADRLVLTKTDLADRGRVDLLTGALRRLNPAASLFRSADRDLDGAALLLHDTVALAGQNEVARRWFAEELSEEQDHHHASGPDVNRHGDRVRAFALTLEGTIDWTMFGIWLTMMLNRHGAAVLRVKGILNVAGSQTPVAVHGVQHLVHPPVHMAAWPTDDRHSRLVFIVDGLDRAAIQSSLAAYLGPAASVRPPSERSTSGSGQTLP